jgi:signal peptidase I
VLARRTGRLAGLLLAALLFALLVSAVGCWLFGGRWQDVESPSMGSAAPVGTLVLTRPADVPQLRVGDVITFRPPVRGLALHTHRIVAINGDLITTRGDLNGTNDPWQVRQRDVVGVVVARLWGVGWLIKALPVLCIGLLVLFAGTLRWANTRWRAPVRVVGTAVVVCLAVLVYRPFLGMSVVSTTSDRPGLATGHVVSTGLLPIDVAAARGSRVVLTAGHLGAVSGPVERRSGRTRITARLHLSPGWWVAVLLLCGLPLFGVLVLGLPPAERRPVPA